MFSHVWPVEKVGFKPGLDSPSPLSCAITQLHIPLSPFSGAFLESMPDFLDSKSEPLFKRSLIINTGWLHTAIWHENVLNSFCNWIKILFLITPPFPPDACHMSGAPCQMIVRQLSGACQMPHQTSVLLVLQWPSHGSSSSTFSSDM